MWNHRSYRNNLMLTSLFALFTFGAYFTGLQQGRSSVRPEIRSSNTSIVQVDRSATTRLQAQVAQDGGSIEAPAVTPEQPAVEEERSDASTDEPALEPEPPTVEEVDVEEPETPVVEDEVELEPEDMSSDLDLPTNTDEISGTDGGNEDAPEEPTLEEELTGGEQANQNLQEIADNIYGAGDRADAYLRENLGNGVGTVVSSPVRLVTGLGGLVTQGTGYVAEGAYDYVLAPIGRGATGAWNYFFGDDSNEDSDEDTPAEKPKVEEERSDAPTVENAPEAEASAVERPTPDNTGAEDGSAPAELAEEGNWFTRGVGAVGDFFTETIPEVAEDAWDATTGAIDDHVVQPVQDLFNGDSDEKESEVEPPAPAPTTERPTVDNTGAEDGSAPAEPAEYGNWFTRGADAVGDFFTETIPGTARDVHNYMDENVYQPTGKVINENIVEPVQDLFNGDSDEKESEVEPPAPTPERPTVDNTGAEDGSAPAEPAEEGNWFTRGADAVGDFFTETIPETARDVHNYMDENVYQPTGKVINENIVEPVQDLFNGDSDEKESEVEPPAPSPEVQKSDDGTWLSRNVYDPAKKAWNGFTGFLGFGSDDKKVEKPTGLSPEDEPIVRTVSPTGARGQAPATPDMTRLSEFLKSKGLSDADIQTAVALARGQEPQVQTSTAEKPMEQRDNSSDTETRTSSDSDNSAPTGQHGLKDTLGAASHPTYSLTDKDRRGINITINGMISKSSDRG